MNIVCAN